MNADEPPFYLVWRDGGDAPVHKHKSVIRAENEAERLARQNPGQCFYVLTPTAMAVEKRVTIVRFDPLASEVPF